MSLHAPELAPPAAHPGETQTPPETLDQAFKDAKEAFYGIAFEPGFQALRQEREIPLDEMNTPRYWAAVSDFAHRAVGTQRAEADQHVQQGRMSHGERSSLEKRLVVQELAAATPDFIYHQAYLEKHPYGANRDTVHQAVRTVSFYNSLIRDTAAQWPEATASGLMKDLSQIANIGIEHTALRKNAPRMIGESIVGAQHEQATEQILEHTGYRFRSSTTSEDVDRGADYIVYRRDGREVLVNVKASNHELRSLGNFNPVGYNGKGILLVNLVSYDELGDRFSIPDGLAAQKAASLSAAIEAPGGHGRNDHRERYGDNHRGHHQEHHRGQHRHSHHHRRHHHGRRHAS